MNFGQPIKIKNGHNWRIDDDGFLRVTARILKEGVFPYGANEAGCDELLPGVDPVMQYIPASEYTPDALKSLEGKPVTMPSFVENEEWHEWRTPDNAMRDMLTVGSVAGSVVPKGPYIECDLLITDKQAINAIVDEIDPTHKLVEVSAGYEGAFDPTPGNFEGQDYHGSQTNFRFNHVLLLPAGMGRCGSDVRIYNQKKQSGEIKMAQTISIKIGNISRNLRFTNEEDAKVAEDALEEQRKFNADELQQAMETVVARDEEIKALKEEKEDAMAKLEAAKGEIENLLSPEAQAELVEELREQEDAEEAIIEAETENQAEAEEIKNSLRGCKTINSRRRALVSRVLNSKGAVIGSDWNDQAFDGAFIAMYENAKRSRQVQRVPFGNATPKNGGALRITNRDRMLAHMPKNNREALRGKEGK